MKRWIVDCNGFSYVCSLQSLAGRAKIAQFKSDCGKAVIIQFLKFFDFSRAKDSNIQSAWLKVHGDTTSSRCKIIFK